MSRASGERSTRTSNVSTPTSAASSRPAYFRTCVLFCNNLIGTAPVVVAAIATFFTLAGCSGPESADPPTFAIQPIDTPPPAQDKATPSPLPTSTPDPGRLALIGLTVRVMAMEVLPIDASAGRYSPSLAFFLQYSNVSSNDIRAFTGIVTFKDLFDRDIKSLSLTYENTIPAGTSVSEERSYRLNQFLDDDQRLMSATTENTKVTWQTTSVILADGTKVDR